MPERVGFLSPLPRSSLLGSFHALSFIRLKSSSSSWNSFGWPSSPLFPSSRCGRFTDVISHRLASGKSCTTSGRSLLHTSTSTVPLSCSRVLKSDFAACKSVASDFDRLRFRTGKLKFQFWTICFSLRVHCRMRNTCRARPFSLIYLSDDFAKLDVALQPQTQSTETKIKLRVCQSKTRVIRIQTHHS
jgi:hypothetical protein